MPALAAGIGVAGLVVAGVVSLSVVFTAAMVGGMLLMHTRGHGAHGGHANQGEGGSDGHGGSVGGGARPAEVSQSPVGADDQRNTHACH
jgi:hypothetical protein